MVGSHYSKEPGEKSTLRMFFYWIQERHKIYIKKTRGDPWPWTKDPILKEYKFTNVYRELDTGTIFCRKTIREPYAAHPELFFNIAMYRLFNLIDTYKDIGFVTNYDYKKIEPIIRSRRENGLQVFTGAHMITGTLGGDKIWQVFGLCLPALWERRKELEPKPGDTLESAFNRLNKSTPGFGPFISYEVISDLRWTRYLCGASDIMTWANPGPGCMRGLNRLLGLSLNPTKQLPKEKYIHYMRRLLEMSSDPFYGCEWMPDLTMREVEHSLCEFFKYEKVRLGLGHPRSKYIPPHLRII